MSGHKKEGEREDAYTETLITPPYIRYATVLLFKHALHTECEECNYSFIGTSVVGVNRGVTSIEAEEVIPFSLFSLDE